MGQFGPVPCRSLCVCFSVYDPEGPDQPSPGLVGSEVRGGRTQTLGRKEDSVPVGDPEDRPVVSSGKWFPCVVWSEEPGPQVRSVTGSRDRNLCLRRHRPRLPCRQREGGFRARSCRPWWVVPSESVGLLTSVSCCVWLVDDTRSGVCPGTGLRVHTTPASHVFFSIFATRLLTVRPVQCQTHLSEDSPTP